MATSLFVKRMMANACCFGLLLLYVMFGGLLLLRFERGQSERAKDELIRRKTECIRHFLRYQSDGIFNGTDRSNESVAKAPTLISAAERITEHCLFEIVDPAEGRRRQTWNFRNAILYGFGILTTLGECETGEFGRPF
ncbi:hypothetical protein niasHT_005797 [Heterodera trifolii]|uniref:Uncharacterized protein n=1 Tax=Heterodera trifolii TaxID=157864 RepID=A0ABD2LTK7_9BILA